MRYRASTRMTRFAKAVSVSFMTTMNVSLPRQSSRPSSMNGSPTTATSNQQVSSTINATDRDKGGACATSSSKERDSVQAWLTLPTSTHCASAFRRKPEVLAGKPVQFRDLATFDLESASGYHLAEADVETAIRFVDAVEATARRIGRNPRVGSLRFAYELSVPDLRVMAVGRFPYLLFYFDTKLPSTSGDSSTPAETSRPACESRTPDSDACQTISSGHPLGDVPIPSRFCVLGGGA